MLSILNFFTLARSKVVQWVAIAGVILMVALKVRSDIRKDAQEDVIHIMEKRDAQRAKAIRDRVNSVPVDRMRPVDGDQRGYRD